MLETVDDHFRTLENSDAIDAMDTFYQRAYALISSNDAREAFNLNAEDNKLRERIRAQCGRAALPARSAVWSKPVSASSPRPTAAGTTTTTSRARSNATCRTSTARLARLIGDLDDRGLLDSTLVMVTSEFGRTPKINKNAGRDHWPKVFSGMLAGGGIKRGSVYGRSDSLSAEPDENPLSPENLATTVYGQLGITADKELMAPGARPIEIVQGGQVVEELLG